MRHPERQPPKLIAGDKVRFVSPASTPDKDAVLQRAKILESWGLTVDFGEHAFDRIAYLAGTDEERLADFNGALRDPEIRAIFATRGGKGSYRIADQLDFAAARNDPKYVVGFSDITILHLSLQKHCGLVGIHGALTNDGDGVIGAQSIDSLRRAVMTDDNVIIEARADEETATLTTGGVVTGRLIGGNLDLISTAAGWALPNLRGAILLIEAVSIQVGRLDRQLTMLRRAGHLNGLAGVVVGQFAGFRSNDSPNDPPVFIQVLRDHLQPLNIPILGGLPLGHGRRPLSIPTGTMARLDANERILTCFREAAGSSQ
ncbi:MAG: LD-carboxypeptidase [Pseudomonadota bacterium]